MLWIQRLWLRLQSLFRREQIGQQLDEEMQFHLEEQIAENVAAGMSREDARHAAMRAFGNSTVLKEEARETWGWVWLEQIGQDLRYGFRALRKSPLFTTVAVLTLAFGIGANTAIFSLMDQVLLQALPVKRPGQLVLVAMNGRQYGSSWGSDHISYPVYEALRDRNQVFSGMLCRYPLDVTMVTSSHTERVDAELVSGSYFPVLGVGAALGRTLTQDDDRVPGGHPVMMLSYAFWQSRFASDPAIVGQIIEVSGQKLTVIGVAPPGFDGVELGYKPQLFIPMMMQRQVTRYWDGLHVHYDSWITAFGRLKPGINAAQANAATQPVLQGILEHEITEPWFRNYTDYDRRQYLQNVMDIRPASQGWSYLRERLQTPLWVLIALTGAVLLLTCANVANLLLARATTREREIAVRVAIGAGRGRIMRALLVESLLLSGAGAAIGLALAFAADRLLLALYFSGEVAGEFVISANPDLRVLAFTICVTVFTAILFGLAPAMQSSRVDLALNLKDRAATGTSSVFTRKLLVAGQVALSLLLLVGAGLFLHSLTKLRGMGPGFSTERLLCFNLDPSLSGYDDKASFAFYRRLMEDLQAIPGVTSVGAATVGILQNGQWRSAVSVEGYSGDSNEDLQANFNQVSAGYLATLGVPLIAGHGLTPHDTSGSQPVALINETFARKYFPGRNPIGLHIGEGTNPTLDEVVGIVKDIKHRNLRDDIPPQVFYPYLAATHIRGMAVYVRSALPPERIIAQIRDTVRHIDPSVPLFDAQTVDEEIDRTLTTERLVAGLATVFGGLATLLAVVGLYGVTAYVVARRMREFGVRVALGALQSDVLWLVMRDVLMLIGVGLAVGVPLAFALSSLIRSQLFGLGPHDPLTLIFSTLTLALVACLAGLIPALRASRTDPMQSLRNE